MSTLATRKNAALAGIWIVMGSAATDALENATGANLSQGAAFYVWAIPFFVAPVAIFVLGTNFFHAFRDGIQQRAVTRTYLVQLGHAFIRMLCWFMAAAMTGFAYSWWHV